MASIFRPTYTKTDPASGKRERHRSQKWYIQYRDAAGIVRRVPGFTDKDATLQRAAKLDREAALEQVGVVDRFAEHRRAPLAEHFKAFREHLEAKGDVPRHVYIVEQALKASAEACGFRTFADIDGAKLTAWLHSRRGESFGARTFNRYLSAAKSFTRWMLRSRRAAEDPLAHLSRVNEATDIRRRRRALSAEEAQRLVAVARSAAHFYGRTGPDRAMLYLLAYGTGLRAGELASLSASSFDFDAAPPTVTVEAANSKHRRRDVLPLHPALVEELRRWLEGRPAGALWPQLSGGNTSKLIKHDLELAGIPYETEDGFADFHALRHSFLTALARSGAHPKAMQALARHSSVELTLGRYSHFGLVDMSAALKALPLRASEAAQPKLAAGAEAVPLYGEEAAVRLARQLAHPAGISRPDLAAAGKAFDPRVDRDHASKPKPCPALAAVDSDRQASGPSSRLRAGLAYQSEVEMAKASAQEGLANSADAGLHASLHEPPGNASAGGPPAPPADPALARVVEAWPELPEHIRAAILALVQTVKP